MKRGTEKERKRVDKDKLRNKENETVSSQEKVSISERREKRKRMYEK